MENQELHPENYFFSVSWDLCDKNGYAVDHKLDSGLTPDRLIRLLLKNDDTIEGITVIRTYRKPTPEVKPEKEST